MASSFVPKGREELLLRTPLTFGFSAPVNMYQPRTTSSDATVRDGFSAASSREQQRAKMKLMSRNTPHTAHVKSMKGLTDNPICSVEDNLARPRPMSALTDRDLSNSYRPPGSSRYSANTDKQLFAVGVVPVTNQWRDELMRKAQKALSKALGQDQPSGSRPNSRPLSRQGSRSLPRQFDHLDDKALLDMMCQILHTDSIPHCQEWLNNAPEDQKDIVLNMIRLAALGGDESEDLPTRPPSRYVWHPPQQSRRHSDPLLGDSLNALSLNTHPRYLFSQPGNVGDGGRRGREGEGGRRGEGGGGRGGGRGEGGGGTSGDKLKALGLPRLVGTQKDPTKTDSYSNQRQGKLIMRRSQSHDASCSPLMEELEGDAYKARASRRLVKNTDFDRGERVKSDEKKQKRRSGASDDSIHNTTVLPPLLHPRQQVVKQQRPRSRSVGGADTMEPRVSSVLRGEKH